MGNEFVDAIAKHAALHNYGHDKAFPPPRPDGNPIAHINWLAEENNETNHVPFHVILLGVGNIIYIPHTLVPLRSLGLDSQRVKKLALKLHAHSVHYAHKLVQTRRSLERSPHLQTNQERSASFSARKPPDPH